MTPEQLNLLEKIIDLKINNDIGRLVFKQDTTEGQEIARDAMQKLKDLLK